MTLKGLILESSSKERKEGDGSAGECDAIYDNVVGWVDIAECISGDGNGAAPCPLPRHKMPPTQPSRAF
jgi:hypothetical protein